ncbi:ABC transporter permease [Flintibacter muris]|uniref:ABC transporter permease n=1 Tax=Flintibacter muris TaxID=2941327 RepID=UPI00203C16DD|nr:ABC transporter permease [Flintibacter muris]
MSKNKNVPLDKRALELVRNNAVPIMFIIICAIFIPMAGFTPGYLINEIITRMGRNLFLVLCLLFPIMAGMGMNFAMTLGAMGAELAIILVADWQIWGIPGVVLAMILSIPFSAVLGLVCGAILNMAKGREMITGYILNFFMGSGIYMMIVLYIMGPIIPIAHSSIMLPRGYGIRNTVSLLNMRQCLDDLLAIRIQGVKIPVLTFILVGLFCLFIVWFRRTKLGQDMRAVGQDMEVARAAGIKVDRTRLISIMMSTVFAGFGMVIYLQNMGNLPTYTGHSQIGMFCIAALLIGGASVEKASIGNAFLGVILFHLMFIVAPNAGGFITGDSMVGEYFRVFMSYGIITIALIMYEAKKRMNKSKAGRELAQAQREGEGAQ